MPITRAIEERKLLSFIYEGHQRIVIPAALGIHRSTRSQQLRAYQVGGSSRSNRMPPWRLFDVRRMHDVLVLPETFDMAPPGYRRGDRHLGLIHAQL